MRQEEATLTISPESFVGALFWCSFSTIMAVRFAPDWLIPLLPFGYFAWLFWNAARQVKERRQQEQLEAERLEKERLGQRAAYVERQGA